MATAVCPLPWSSRRMSRVLFQQVRFLASSAECLNYSSVKKYSAICTRRSLVPRVISSCDGGGGIQQNEIENRRSFGAGEEKKLSCVMKFGGSSVASAEGMRNVADLMLSEERPVIVLSAIGKTTNKLLLAGEKASNCYDISYVSAIDEFRFIKDL